MSTIVRIPADVDRSDRILGPFTARQLAVLATAALLLYSAWTATRTAIAPMVFAAVAAPVFVVVAVAVLTRRDGLSADLLLVAAIRHRFRPRHLVRSRGSTRAETPRWIATRAKRSRPRPPLPTELSANQVRLPQSVSNGGTGDVGVIDLGADGLAVIAVAGTLNLSLRTPAEQDSLVGQLAGWLHTLRQPVQILVRSARLDLTEHITGLHTAAEQMSPDLAAAALDHADHLAELTAREDPVHRQVLLIWREQTETLAATGLRARLPGRSRARRALSGGARRAAESRLLRRMNEAADVLSPLGISVTALDDVAATAVLTSCTNPEGLVSAAVDIAAADAIITADPQVRTPDPFTGEGLDRFAPESLTIGTRHLEIGSDWTATLAVTGYPREVTAGWLAPLLSHPGRVEVAVHIDPIDPATAATRLRRQQARLESSRMHDVSRGRLTDPQVDVAVEDAADLSARVARAEARLFRVGVYLSVHADTEAELADEVAAVRALAASLLVDTCTLSYRAAQAWATTLPLGLDLIRVQRTFDTTALGSAFPFDSPQLPAPDPAQATRPHGVLYGRDAASGLVFVDRFAPEAHNHNLVILGRSGAGKSYLVKTEILRSLYRGIEQVVIDPEDEYRRLAAAVGGTHIRLGAPGVRLNPFDLEIHARLDGRRTAPPDALIRRKLFLHTLIQVLLGDQTAAQRTALDAALAATYTAAGITEDPATWTRPAPTLSGLRAQLDRMNAPAAAELAAGLHPFVGEGAYAGLLDGPTTTDPAGGLIVFSLRELAEELKTIGTLLVLDATWRRVSHPGQRRPRMITVDEAWLLLRLPAGAQFLFRAAKSFRKHWAGLTVATQDCADVCSTELGRAIVSNAATQILLRQAPQAIDEVAAAFHLSDGEQQFLLSAARGAGLLAVGGDRAVFGSLASATENAIITTDPGELAANNDEADTDIEIDAAAPLPALTEPDDLTTAQAQRSGGDIDADEQEEVMLDSRAA
ncbi:TraG/VirB4 family ATPase [Nocardia amikacinitolerans]|uniref:TraG/VirB4 family ATPase n=1 Tax=Nocardia amikacinitolerans TaxID=756689 RepID=UPI0020A275B0|nr:PrgI family protein [Nocardia amikacinitolerans]MCP2290791.1 Type IV secretory pathway, VirB4 component [Nocardia amikacinitolerans]